jgi:hypothetical protein
MLAKTRPARLGHPKSYYSKPVGHSPSGNRRKNALPCGFACILVAAWEGQLHALKLIYSALRVDWLMYRAPSAKKIPSRFFLKARFASTATIQYFGD